MVRSTIPAVLLLLATAVSALEQSAGGQIDEDDARNRYTATIKEEAAKFVIARRKAKPDPAKEEKAAKLIAEARAELDAKHDKQARRLAEKVYDKYPYTAAAAESQHILVAVYARGDEISSMREALNVLWWYYPEYDRLGPAMLTALDAAERAQGFAARINLDADHPNEVIKLDGATYVNENNQLFDFLAANGDRDAIAPRAQIGLARALLLRSDTRFLGIDVASINETYAAYEKFLATWPDHDLAFTAVCELALAHLITYRGNLFDVGALDAASRLIDQAEQETRNDPERTRLAQAYRKRIRAWHQDRDLQVARWYHHRKEPSWLAWLRDPSPAIYVEAARVNYREVIRRDPGSPLARIAEREMAALPPPRQESFGAELLGPAKP